MMKSNLFRPRFLSSISLLPLLLSGCGGNQSFEKSLDEMWQWDGGVEASQVLKALEGKKASPTVPAAVGVTGRGLIGRTLPSGKLWKYEGEIDVLPTLVGDAVIFSGDGKVTALDVTTGKKKYSVPVNARRLEGAGYDGTHSILLLVDSDDAREDQVLVLGAQGQKIYSATANARLGTPAAIGGVGLVPYAGQYVGGLDLSSGEHMGRVLVRDGLHTARSTGDGVVLFGAGATLMNGALTSSPDSRSLKLDPRKLPGEPPWPIDGSKPRPVRSAPVGIYAFPRASEGTFGFAGGGYVATYFEVVIGLDQSSNELRWATHFPRAVAGGDAGPHGPTLCLENGSIVRVNIKDGNHVPFGSLESKVKACVVSASSDPIPQGDRPSVLEQLEQTISGTGPDMVAMQKVLLAELGTSKTGDTTKSLLAIAQNPLVSADLAREAAKLLRTRKNGGEELIAALLLSAPKPPEPPPGQPANDKTKDGVTPKPTKQDKSEDNDTWSESPDETKAKDPPPNPPLIGEPAIEDGARRREKLRPPPVGAVAHALAKMKTPGAAAALAPYLGDPSLSAVQQLSLMEALLVLGTGDATEIAHVNTFLSQYKNTGGEEALTDALVLATHFLFKYLDDAGRSKLQKSLDQSLTHPVLTKKLEKDPPKIPPAAEDAPQEKADGGAGGSPAPKK